MPAMSVGGLASGLDTNSIIAQLTALEQAKVTREVQKKENARSTLEKFKELETRLGNLQQKAKALELPKDFNVFKASSNYEDYASISGGEGATAGQYELVVHQLATTQKVASNSFGAINKSMEDEGFLLAGQTSTISLSTNAATQKADPKKTEVEIKINASDTLKDIVNKINAAEGSGVKASLMTMSDGTNRLVLTAVDTGSTGFFLQDNTGSNFLSDIGILVKDAPQNTVSSSALLTDTGTTIEAATGDTKLKDISVAFNSIKDNDKFTVTIGGVSYSSTISSAATTSIQDVLDDINTQLGGSLTASINKSGEIVFEGDVDTKDISVKITDASDKTKIDLGKFAERNVFVDTNVINEGKNAFYTVDGIAVSSQSNSDDKTINGTTFNLKKADPGKTIKLSLEPDMSSLADKISAFVEEFNALLKFIDENAKATVKEETDKETGKKINKRVVGAFTGDSGISSLRENLRRMFSSTINEIANSPTMDSAPNPKYNGFYTVYSSASRLGIISNREGFYDVDKEKLTKALNADFEGVRKLFTSGGFSNEAGFSVGRFGKDAEPGVYEYKREYDSVNDKWIQTWTLNGKEVEGNWSANNLFTTKNGLNIELPEGFVGTAKVTFVRGIAGQLSNFVEKANAGYYSETMGKFVDGYFKSSKATYQNRIDEIQKRVDQLQIRVDNYNSRLVKQFSALERSMSNLQAQSANMMSALSGISYKK